MVTWYEVVWTFRGVDMDRSEHDSRADADTAFRSGRLRVQQLIHGGSLRIDELSAESEA